MLRLASRHTGASLTMAKAAAASTVGSRRMVSHAISNPTLMNLDQRWEAMGEEERSDIIGQLSERQKGDWKELTEAEKKATWYISYGAWGPRKPIHPEGEVKKITTGVAAIVIVAGALFALSRYMSEGLPRTMNREWQEATNEHLKEKNVNPFSGFNMVQSRSKGLPTPKGE